MAKQWIQRETSYESSIWNSSKHSFESKLSPRENFRRRSGCSVTTISGLAVHSHGAYGEDWEGAIFSMSPGTNSVGGFSSSKNLFLPRTNLFINFIPMQSGKRGNFLLVQMKDSVRSMHRWVRRLFICCRFLQGSHPTQKIPHILSPPSVCRATA